MNNNYKDLDHYEEEIILLALSQTTPFRLSEIADQMDIPKHQRNTFYKQTRKILESKTPLVYPINNTRYNDIVARWWQPIIKESNQ